MLADHKGEIPFVVYLLPFLTGIGVALSFNLTGFTSVFITLLFPSATAFIGLNVLYARMKLYQFKFVGGVLMHLVLLLAGLVCAVSYDERNSGCYFEKSRANYLLVKINNETQFKAGMLRFTAKAEQAVFKGAAKQVDGTLLITIRTDSAHAGKLAYGDELMIPANYTAIDPPFNPGEFNYKQYLAHQNIYAQVFLNPAQYVLMHQNAGNPFMAYSFGLRQKLIEKLKVHIHNAEAIGVASTLILGYKADLSNDILQAYSKTGTIHVLSVSGSHVAIIFTLIGFLFGFFDRHQHGRVLKAIISISLIWFYAMLSGFSPAVCRAALMLSLIIIGRTTSRQINTLNILAFSAFVLLLYDPFLLADVGFQLSYLSVGGLIVFQPIIYKLLNVEQKWLDWLWAFFSASLAAQLITFPLSAYYFHQFPVYFLLSNLFILPLSVIIMYTGMAYLILPQIPFVSAFLATLLEKSILWMDGGLVRIAHSPYASINKVWLSQFEYILWYAVIILLFYWLYSKKFAALQGSLIATLLLCTSFSAKHIKSDGDARIVFFDLKKHQGILFKNGDQAVFLTDLADTDKVYRYSVQPALDSLGIANLQHCDFKHNAANLFFRKQSNLIQFLDKKLFLFNRESESLNLPQKLKIDYLYVDGPPRTGWAFINKNYNYRLLIVGANNTDKVAKALADSATTKKIKFVCLKRNYSVTLPSK